MTAKLGYRRDIEGLRGLAVLLVILFHVRLPGFQGGFVGVDVFFVISGYLITRLLVDEIHSAGRIRILAFYARRARRLLPAAALTITATLVASWFLLSPLAQFQLARTALAATTYWSNIRFAIEAGDYFGETLTADPLLHTWSLAVEEQFYLVWPALVAVAVLLGRRRRGFLLGALSLVTLGSFVLSLWATGASAHWAFFGSPARAWEFGVGALASLAFMHVRDPMHRVGIVIGWIGLVGVVAAGVLASEASAWPGVGALLPTLGSVFVLVSGVMAPRSALQSLLASPPLQVLGRLSYTWYLWHWPALVLAEAAVGPLSLPVRLAVATGSLGLSAITHQLVENPVRFHPRLAAPGRALGAMLAVTLVVAGGATAGMVIGSGNEQHQRYIAAASDRSPSVSDGCHVRTSATDLAEDCVYGDSGSGTVVVLVGDSHATMWFPAVERLALERGWRLLVHTKSSCPVAEVQVIREDGTRYTECEVWREAVMKDVEQLEPSLVIATSFATYNSTDPEVWAAGLARALIRMDESAGTVVYVRDIPQAPFEAPACLSTMYVQAHEDTGACSFERHSGLAGHAWEADGIERAGISSIDLNTTICPGVRCSVEVDGMVIYRDSHHLTATYSASLAGELGASIDVAMAEDRRRVADSLP